MYQLNTTLWYEEYQRLVHEVPGFGTESTTLWYERYQCLVFLIKIGDKILYQTITVL